MNTTIRQQLYEVRRCRIHGSSSICWVSLIQFSESVPPLHIWVFGKRTLKKRRSSSSSREMILHVFVLELMYPKVYALSCILNCCHTDKCNVSNLTLTLISLHYTCLDMCVLLCNKVVCSLCCIRGLHYDTFVRVPPPSYSSSCTWTSFSSVFFFPWNTIRKEKQERGDDENDKALLKTFSRTFTLFYFFLRLWQ